MEAAWPSGLGHWIYNLEIPGSNYPLGSVVHIANWSATHQLGFKIVCSICNIYFFI